MSNEFYDHTIFPTPGSPGSSAGLRAELDKIEAGFDKLPTLASNGGKVVIVNSGATALEATDSVAGLSLATPTIVGGTINGAAIGGTTPASGAFTTATVGGAAVVTTTALQSLTGKTIDGSLNTLSNIGNASLANSSFTIGSTSLALGATTTTLAGLASVAATTFTGALTGNATNVTGTVALANGGTGATDASTARANLGLAIGSNVQAWDADLDSIAALSGTSGLLRKTGANTWALEPNDYLTGNQTVTFSGDATGSGTTAVTLTLANSGVTAGTYNNVTVNAKGLVTFASNVSYLTGNQAITFSGDATGSGTTAVTLTLATVPVAKGGTGATTATGARTNLLPSFTGNAGKALVVNGGGTDVEFLALAGTGTVTSVALTTGLSGLTVSGSPVTAAGTLDLSGTLGVASGGTGATALSGVVIGNGAQAFSAKTNPAGDFVGTSDAQTLTNKTLSSPDLTDGLRLSGASGISGQVLTSQGSGAAPIWGTVAGSPDFLLFSQGVI